MNIKFSAVRDISATALGVMIGGIGIAGVAAKKFFIASDDSTMKKILVGLAATLVTGGAALIPYLVASGGRETKADLAAARAQVVDARYNNTNC
jgi:hypothetical protein